MAKRRNCLTEVYQINEGAKRLLWIGERRKVQTLLKFFRWIYRENMKKIECVASDKWKPYFKVIACKVKNAMHVLDRFHIMKMMNDALNDTRKAYAQKLQALPRNLWVKYQKM